MVLSQKAVGPGKVFEDSNIVGYHDRQVAATRIGGPQVVAMPLDGHGHGGGIEPVGPVSDPASPAAGPEGKHLPKGIEEQVQLPGLKVPPEDPGLGVGYLAREPMLQVVAGLPARVPVLLNQPVDHGFQPVGRRHLRYIRKSFPRHRIHPLILHAVPATA